MAVNGLTLVKDPKGRLVSPLEPLLDDVTPAPTQGEELLAFIRSGTGKLAPGSTVVVAAGTNPVNGEPLNYACNAGWASEDMALLAEALDKDKDPLTVQSQLNNMLLVQAERNSAELCHALIAAGASPNGSRRAPMQPQAGDWTVGGATPLHLACFSGSVDAAEALVAAGADVMATDDAGETPFDYAMHGAVVECGWSSAGSTDGSTAGSTGAAATATVASALSSLETPDGAGAAEEEPVPYGGNIQAAMKAGDRAAIRVIMAAKSKKGAAPHPGIARRLRCAAALGDSDRAIPTGDEVKQRVKTNKAKARILGPQQELEKRRERGALLRQELELTGQAAEAEEGGAQEGEEGGEGEGAARATMMRVLFSPAKGCLWDHHWYMHTARSVKARAPGSVATCVLQWIHTLAGYDEEANKSEEEQAADRAAGGWKARHLSEAMVGGSGGVGGAEASEGSDCIVVGHSSGGNAALRLAERRRVGSLIVIGAGNSTEDYAQDTAARELAASAGVDPDPDLVIVPFDFQAIVRNVTGSIVVVHGDGDDVIHPSEATLMFQGLEAAVAAIAAAPSPAGGSPAGGSADECPWSPPELQLRLEAGEGHFMVKRSALVEDHIIRALERHSNT